MYGVPATHLSLNEYWEILQISECFGYGIRSVPDAKRLGCNVYWDQSFRYWLAFSIRKTEQRLKADRWLGFPVRREYNDGNNPRQLEYAFPLYLGKYVRGIGVETETTVESGVAVALRTLGTINDPVTITVNVSFTDPNELLVRYPELYFSQNCRPYTIRPSCVTIEDGVATIEIPRCRLLKPEFFRDYDQVNDRPEYPDDANFLDTVDITRNYLNTATGANFVWRRGKQHISCWTGVSLCDPVDPCSDIKQLACAYVREQRDGVVQLEPEDGAWAIRTRRPNEVEINFMRGYYDRYDCISEELARAIIAIAHNNMPRDYCKCSVQERYFKQDTMPLEPPVRLGLGPSTWGIYEASEIIREFDAKQWSHTGGML